MRDPMIPPQAHHLEAERVFIEVARHLTAAQQLATLHSLQQSAWALKASLLRREHPDLSEEDIQHRVRNSFSHAAPALFSLFGRSPKRVTDIQAMLQVRGDGLDHELLLPEIHALGLRAGWE